MDSNHDIVPTLRMFNGALMDKAADEIERLRAKEEKLVDLLTSARCIAERQGQETAWERFSAAIQKQGIGSVTAKVFKILESDKALTCQSNPDLAAIEQMIEICRIKLDLNEFPEISEAIEALKRLKGK